jgi:glycosyltransferase involved in cell wall biosynthesis
MPAYNAEKYIAEAINSVLNQSYPEFELLVINDGSSDQTAKIIRSFFDSRIKYFKQNNQGVSSARNTGLENMKGVYFCFLDADDVMPQDSLKSRLEIFNSNNKIDFVDGKVRKKIYHSQVFSFKAPDNIRCHT